MPSLPMCCGRPVLVTLLLLSNADLAWSAPGALRAPTAKDLIELTSLDAMVSSPDGRWIALQTHQADVAADGYRISWWIAPVDGSSPPVVVGDGGDERLFQNSQGGWQPQSVYWSPDSRWIAYLRKTDDGVQVWRSGVDRTPQTQLTHNAADVIGLQWAADGRAIEFTTDAPREKVAAADRAAWMAGYRVDDQTFNAFYEPRPIHPPYRLTGGQALSWIVELEGGTERQTSTQQVGQRGEATARQVVIGPGNHDSVWLQTLDPEVNKGLVPPLTLFASRAGDGSRPVRCPADRCRGNLQTIGWTGTGEVVFMRIELGRRSMLAWSPGSGRLRTILETDHELSNCTGGHGVALCFLRGPASSRRVVEIDYRTGASVTRFDPNPQLHSFALGEPERLEWKNRFGISAWAWLIKPVGFSAGHRYPLVIVQYSAEECMDGGTGGEFPTHLFANNGMMVLCISHPAVNKALFAIEPNPMVLFRADYKDYIRQKNIQSSIESVIELLTKRGLVDPDRVGLTGLSAGVETVQYMLVHSRSIAAAATSGGGMEPISYYGGNAYGRNEMMRPLGWGNPFNAGENWGWRDFSLAWNADRIHVPLLIQAADREYLHAIQTAVSWRDADKPLEMYVFPDEHHVKWHPAHRLQAHERNLDWFNFWLRDLEDPNPAKADQYVRWREWSKSRAE